MSPGWPFVAEGDGVRVNLEEREQELLANLVVDMRHLLMADPHDALRRLKPPAHADNEDAEASYREMVDDDLLRGRLELLDVVEEGLGGALLDEMGVTAWMQSLNNMRLVLGERLSLDGVDLEAADLPDGPVTFLYRWTGELLELLVRATGSTPGVTDHTNHRS